MKSKTKFLVSIKKDIDNGKYDGFLNIPFISRNLIYSCFKNIINEKMKNNKAPVLNEEEINIGLNDAKQTAAETFDSFLKKGIIIKDGDEYKVSETYINILK